MVPTNREEEKDNKKHGVKISLGIILKEYKEYKATQKFCIYLILVIIFYFMVIAQFYNYDQVASMKYQMNTAISTSDSGSFYDQKTVPDASMFFCSQLKHYAESSLTSRPLSDRLLLNENSKINIFYIKFNIDLSKRNISGIDPLLHSKNISQAFHSSFITYTPLPGSYEGVYENTLVYMNTIFSSVNMTKIIKPTKNQLSTQQQAYQSISTYCNDILPYILPYIISVENRLLVEDVSNPLNQVWVLSWAYSYQNTYQSFIGVFSETNTAQPYQLAWGRLILEIVIFVISGISLYYLYRTCAY